MARMSHSDAKILLAVLLTAAVVYLAFHGLDLNELFAAR